MAKKIYSLIGLPCAGKSHVAKLIADKIFNNKCTHISAGDIARSLMTTPELKTQTVTADLFPLEDLIRSKISELVENAPNLPVIMEGVPRFDLQAEWFINNFWTYQPEIIQINVGDVVTLHYRAKMRGRDSDTDFTKRLATAEKNMAGVFRVLSSRTVPTYNLFNDNDEQTIKAFHKLFPKARSI